MQTMRTGAERSTHTHQHTVITWILWTMKNERARSRVSQFFNSSATEMMHMHQVFLPYQNIKPHWFNSFVKKLPLNMKIAESQYWMYACARPTQLALPVRKFFSTTANSNRLHDLSPYCSTASSTFWFIVFHMMILLLRWHSGKFSEYFMLACQNESSGTRAEK